MSDKKQKKKRRKPPINRVIAQLMIDIQDELRMLNLEVKKSKKIENMHLTKSIIKETEQCLSETMQIVQLK